MWPDPPPSAAAPRTGAAADSHPAEPTLTAPTKGTVLGPGSRSCPGREQASDQDSHPYRAGRPARQAPTQQTSGPRQGDAMTPIGTRRNPRPATPAVPQDPAARRWLALAVLAVAQFMVFLDETVVNVALPSIKTSLGFSQTSLAWVIS